MHKKLAILPRRLPESQILSRNLKNKLSSVGGFTLIELMIVVAVIAILATLATPSLLRARDRSQMVTSVKLLQGFADQFAIFNIEERTWPDDRGVGRYPNRINGVVDDAMEQLIPREDWNTEPVYGGEYDWDYDNRGVTAAICVVNTLVPNATRLAMDKLVDDGNLNTGSFRRVGTTGYRIVLQDTSN